MEHFEFIQSVLVILKLEKEWSETNAEKIEDLSMDLIKRIAEERYAPNWKIYQFLDDFDIRRRDRDYAKSQIIRVEKEIAKIQNRSGGF